VARFGEDDVAAVGELLCYAIAEVLAEAGFGFGSVGFCAVGTGGVDFSFEFKGLGVWANWPLCGGGATVGRLAIGRSLSSCPTRMSA
jgi:hypothetical protein